jgi:hypothetical protein
VLVLLLGTLQVRCLGEKRYRYLLTAPEFSRNYKKNLSSPVPRVAPHGQLEETLATAPSTPAGLFLPAAAAAYFTAVAAAPGSDGGAGEQR